MISEFFALNRSQILLGLCGILAATSVRAEYYTFTGENGAKLDGADILYQETRYPYWAQSTYNARWFPGIAGEKTSTSLYSGPVYSGEGEQGTRENGYIWSFWGVDHPVKPGDSVVPVWWHPNMHDVPSIGEGASGKVEGKWTMATGVWYPGLLRIWRPTGNPENTSMAGQWYKDGVSGKWHHMATFQLPFVANRFTGDCGFIEDPSHGNVKPRRVDFRNYFFRKGGKWSPGKVFQPSTRQQTEKGTCGLIENGTAGFFETCSGPSYTGNMGPGAQEVALTLAMKDTPSFDAFLVRKVEAAATRNQVLVKWSLDEKSSPQFAYRVELFASTACEGNPLKVVEKIDPDASELLIATDAAVRGLRVTLTDVFDQVSKPVILSPFAAEPMPSQSANTSAAGLNYRYFEGDWKSFPPADAQLVASGAVNSPDLSIRRKNEGFACTFSGYMEVPSAGIWMFSMRSSDGGKLVVDGDVVIDNGGLHGAGYERTGSRPLAAGKHAVEVACYKAKDGSDEECRLDLSWEGPSRSKEVIPDTAWSRVATAGEPMVKLVLPDNNGALAANKTPLVAAVKAGSSALQMVRFYQNSTVCGVACSAKEDHGVASFGTRELLGAGRHSLRARLIYGEKSEHSIDSPAVLREITQASVGPWAFTSIGKHFFPASSSVENETHTLLGDGLNINWQKISGDTTLVARVKRRPANSWISQFDGSDIDSWWSGGLIFRQDIDAHPGSEMGQRFVALFASAGNSIHMQDHTNHNAGGQFWGKNLQNPQGTYQWLKLQRQGQMFHSFLSVDGEHWDAMETRDLSKAKLDGELYVGVFTLARPSTNTNPNRWLFSDVGIGVDPQVAKTPTETQLYWPMDEDAGSGIANSNRDAFSGVLQNGVVRVTGVSGKAIELNGKDQAVLFPPLGLNANHLTICGWVKRDGEQVPWSGIAMCRGSSATGLMVGPGNQLRFNWDSGKSASYNFSSGLVLPDHQWSFVALVVEPSSATLYSSDGNELRSVVCKGEFDTASFDADFYLGYDPNSNDRRFKGAFDEFRVFRRTLSPAEIKILAHLK